MIEKLNLQDKYRIAFCILISFASLIFVQRYFKIAFPDASIQMDTTREEAQDLAEQFLANSGHGIKVLEESEMIEVKQGPYLEKGDKVRFDAVEEEKIVIKGEQNE